MTMTTGKIIGLTILVGIGFTVLAAYAVIYPTLQRVSALEKRPQQQINEPATALVFIHPETQQPVRVDALQLVSALNVLAQRSASTTSLLEQTLLLPIEWQGKNMILWNVIINTLVERGVIEQNGTP